MIRIQFSYDTDGRLCGVDSKGHAQSAKHGEDLVCAAVSTLLQTCLVALIDGLSMQPRYHMDEGNMSVVLPESIDQEKREQAHIVFNTIRLGLMGVAINNGSYVKILE